MSENDQCKENEKAVIYKQLNIGQQNEENFNDENPNDQRDILPQKDILLHSDINNDSTCNNQNKSILTDIHNDNQSVGYITRADENKKSKDDIEDNQQIRQEEKSKNEERNLNIDNTNNDEIVINNNDKKNVNKEENNNDKTNEDIENNNAIKDKYEKRKKLCPASSTKIRQRITFVENKNGKNWNARNIQKSSKVEKSYSQSNIDYRRQQNARSPITSTQNATPNWHNRDGKIVHSKTMPSSPTRLKNPKYGLFERSLKKSRISEDDSDEFQNCTFTYSNPYYGNGKIVSDITSEKNIIKEVRKRKMWSEKEKDTDVEDMKNQQFKISNYSKKLAKRAIKKKNEKKLQEKDKSIDEYEYDEDELIFADDKILPDDTEKQKLRHPGKLPAYLSRIDTFNKDHKDIIRTTKQEEHRKLRNSKI